MVHKFDPAYANGSVSSFVDWSTLGNHLDCQRANQPIPASYFPKSLTVDKAVQPLPDMFHASRDIIVFSERARALMEELALGQVEFIPVTIHATTSKIGYRLQLASAYYFTNTWGGRNGSNGLECQFGFRGLVEMAFNELW